MILDSATNTLLQEESLSLVCLVLLLSDQRLQFPRQHLIRQTKHPVIFSFVTYLIKQCRIKLNSMIWSGYIMQRFPIPRFCSTICLMSCSNKVQSYLAKPCHSLSRFWAWRESWGSASVEWPGKARTQPDTVVAAQQCGWVWLWLVRLSLHRVFNSSTNQ